MSQPKIGFNSYVDIATCMVFQYSDYEIQQPSGSDRGESVKLQESVSDWTGTDFEINTPDLLKSEWANRIEQWRRQFPDGGPPIEDCKSLKDLQFGAFFLQHPIAAISLWNVMQAFYALDRVVCCTSKEAREKIAEWELMPPFAYLEASSVEKRWRKSLVNLSKEINEKNRDTLLQRIDGIHPGIVKLEDTCGELQRSLRENLKGIKLVDSMLEQTGVAAARRFSMIDTYLKLYENHNGETNIDNAIEGVTGSLDSTRDSKFGKSSFEEPRTFRPLRRTNSMEMVKYHLVVAWVSTTSGEATFTAVVILLILLICLYQIQGYLATAAEF